MDANNDRNIKACLASGLCITENRSSFIPWLIWCYDRQTWPHKELVIVDSSTEPFVSNRSDIRVVQVDSGTGVARKRNSALKEARGEVITWFDDDDWQHPNKLAWLVEALSNGASYAGCSNSWFLDLAAGRCVKHRGQAGRILFNSAGFMKNAVQSIAFKEDIHKASDTHWMHDLERRLGRASTQIIDDKVLFFWLCHKDNLSNPSKRRNFTEPLTALKSVIGVNAWGNTDEALGALRSRLQKKRGGNDLAVGTSCKKIESGAEDSGTGGL